MAWNKKKIAVRIAAVAAGIFFLFLFFSFVFIGHSNRHFETFKREHADAPRIVFDAFGPVSHWGQEAEKEQEHAARSDSQTSAALVLADEIAAIGKDADAIWHFLYYQNRPFGCAGLDVHFPAEEFPEEGTAGALRCGPALRNRTGQYAAKVESGWLRYLPAQPYRVDDRSTTIVLRLPALLDRAERVLMRDDWAWPDLARGGVYTRYLAFFDRLGATAILRAHMAGRHDAASKMFLNLTRLRVYAMLQQYAVSSRGRYFLPLSEGLMIAAWPEGIVSDGALAEAAKMLSQARLNDKQLRALRAMGAMEWDSDAEYEEMKRGDPAKSDKLGGKIYRTFGSHVYFALDAGFHAGSTTVSHLLSRPVAAAWVDGDEAAYIAAIDRATSANMLLRTVTRDRFYYNAQIIFPPDEVLAAEHPFNEGLDELQVFIGVARYRNAHGGRYPENMQDMAPYVDPAVLARGAWGVMRLPAGTYAGRVIYGDTPLSKDDKEYNDALEKFWEKNHRLPDAPRELCTTGLRDELTSKTQSYFIPLVERPIIFKASRDSVRRAFLEWDKEFPPNAELLAHMSPGQDRLPTLRVQAAWPEPELARPDILKLINQH
ncbi:MAG: hypothetical protein ABFD69_13190 [Candidatus Sumerlaeia bacterium]